MSHTPINKSFDEATIPKSEEPLPPEVEAQAMRGLDILHQRAEAEYEKQKQQFEAAFNEEWSESLPPFESQEFTLEECLAAANSEAYTEEPDPTQWVKTLDYTASSHEPDLVTIRMKPLIRTVVEASELERGKWITLIIYVPRKRLPWEMPVRVNRADFSTAATIFWSPLLPTPKYGQEADIWIQRRHFNQTSLDVVNQCQA